MSQIQPTLNEIVKEYSSIIRLSQSLGISRPSTYKYIKAFDEGKKDQIPKDVLRFFETVIVTPKSGRRNLFNEKYNEYLNLKETKELNECVPKDIAETIDRLGMSVEQIDERIENALQLRSKMTELGYGEDHPSVQQVEFDLKRLQLTRDMIEKRNKEIRFWPITEGEISWIVDENGYGMHYPYNEAELEYKPQLKEQFKYGIIKNAGGYTFLFDCPDIDDSIISVKISVSIPGRCRSTVGVFTNNNCENYIEIPKLFDYAYAYNFYYEITRTNSKGRVINSMMEVPFAY